MESVPCFAYNAFDAPDLISPRTLEALIEGGSRLLLDLPAMSIVTASVRVA